MFCKHVEEQFGSATYQAMVTRAVTDTPWYIISWVFLACDMPKATSAYSQKCRGLTHSHTLKMRASVSYGFAHELKRGSEPWCQLSDGSFTGNPSLSREVTHYLCSLRRQKVISNFIGVLHF